MASPSTTFKKASSTEYVAWVQRALNRELGSNLIDNGVITPEYRELVARIQRLHVLGEQGGKVDGPTQNLLVELSNARPDYVWWIQAALTAAGAWSGGAPSGSFDQNTRDGLLSFQSYEGLRDDAWVGPDTETWLIKASGMKPPGAYRFKKPVPPPSKGHKDTMDTSRRVDDWSRQLFNEIRSDLSRMSDDPQMRNRVLCVLSKLKTADTIANLNFRYFTTVLVVKWVRGTFAPGGLVEDGKTRLFTGVDKDAKDLKNQMEQFVFDSRSTHSFADSYIGFEKKLMYYIKQIDAGLAAIEERKYNDKLEANVVVGAMHTWAMRKQNDKNDICSCFRT
jgi:hypothetical protein